MARGPATDGGWSPETGPIPGSPGAVLYSGPFRAQPLQDRGRDADAAGQSVLVRAYLIALEASAPALPPDTRLTIKVAPNDAELVGKVFTVTGTALASERFERDVYADLDLTNQPVGEA